MNGYYMDKYEGMRAVNFILCIALAIVATLFAVREQSKSFELKRLAAEVEMAKARANISATLSFGGGKHDLPALPVPATEPLAVHDEFGGAQ